MNDEVRNGRRVALVTGASSGIGAELSRCMARDGYDLVLTARRLGSLQALADECSEGYGVTAEPIAQDLSAPEAADNLFSAAKKAADRVDILVNCAGFNVYGPQTETDWTAELSMIGVNLVALTRLTQLVLPEMLGRESGRILNVASTAAFSPGPFDAIYFATKAYVLSYSEALAEELDGSGVTVTALCPGATATDFARRARMTDTPLFSGPKMTPRRVAEEGYRAMMTGQRLVVPGLVNKIAVFSVRLAPRVLVARIGRLLLGGKRPARQLAQNQR